MSWQDILGHENVVERFRKCVQRGRLASSFLFAGPPGVGKFRFALELSAALLCENCPGGELDACGTCPACQQVHSESHPDLEIVRKPANRSYLPLEFFVGDKDHRLREGLCHRISLKPFCGGRKIAIIDDADDLNLESANCLLKTLEEPPPRSVLILIGTSEHKQLPTIRSRCQIIRFGALPLEIVQRLIIEQGLAADAEAARDLAELSEGSLTTAQEFADEELRDFREQLFRHLAHPHSDSVAFAKTLTAFVDQAGKDAPAKRRRMRQVILSAATFYRTWLRHQAGALFAKSEDIMQRTIDEALDKWPQGQQHVADKLDRCLLAEDQLKANANVSTLLECWVDDLTG